MATVIQFRQKDRPVITQEELRAAKVAAEQLTYVDGVHVERVSKILNKLDQGAVIEEGSLTYHRNRGVEKIS